jgi:hypothetical protein
MYSKYSVITFCNRDIEDGHSLRRTDGTLNVIQVSHSRACVSRYLVNSVFACCQQTLDDSECVKRASYPFQAFWAPGG